MLNVPDKSPKAKARFGIVEGRQFFEQGGNPVVVDGSENSLGHRRPRMGTVMGFAGFGAAALHFAKRCESTAIAMVKSLDYVLVVSLVVSYHYCFHQKRDLEVAGRGGFRFF